MPQLISGEALAEGALYRFEDVAPGVHAEVEVMTLQGARLKSVDDNNTLEQLLRPVVESEESSGFASIAVSLINSSDHTTLPMHTSVSIIGTSIIADSLSIAPVSDYSHDLFTSLDVSATGENEVTVNFEPETAVEQFADSYFSLSASVIDKPRLIIEIYIILSLIHI